MFVEGSLIYSAQTRNNQNVHHSIIGTKVDFHSYGPVKYDAKNEEAIAAKHLGEMSCVKGNKRKHI